MNPLQNPDIETIRKNEREIVLNKLDKKIMKRVDALLDEFQHAKTRTQKDKIFERRCGVGEVLDMIEEIRSNEMEEPFDPCGEQCDNCPDNCRVDCKLDEKHLDMRVIGRGKKG